MHVQYAQAAIKIIAKNCVLASGVTNSLSMLLRSSALNPQVRLGSRTFLRPVVMLPSIFDQKVKAWGDALQPINGAMGYKLAAPPLHPLIFVSTVPGFGQGQHDLLSSFAHNHTLLALLRAGFYDEAPGGQVKWRGDGSVMLGYPLGDYAMPGARQALLSMMKIQFAAGARQVLPLHEITVPSTSWTPARDVALA